MDPASVTLLISLIARGIGVSLKIAELAKRVKAGEAITESDIAAAEKSVEAAMNRWRKNEA